MYVRIRSSQRARGGAERTAVLVCFAFVFASGCSTKSDPGRTNASEQQRADLGRPDPSGIWFENIADATGLGSPRVPKDRYGTLSDRMSGGVCAIDVDGRDPVDLFFAFRPSSAGGSRLYVGQGTLDYQDEAASRGLGDVGDAFGCLAFDADGDRDDDLLVTGLGTLRLFENDGGSFVDRSSLLGVDVHADDMYFSAAAGDVDRDGDIDLVVAGYLRAEPLEHCGGCVSDTYANPLPNLLLLRREDGYVESAADIAPDLARREPTLMVSICDLDGDGATEIYVGNDRGSRYPDRPLQMAENGVYRDVGTSMGLDYSEAGHGIDTMGVSHGDINGDGTMDHVQTGFSGQPTGVFLCEHGRCDDRATEVGTDRLADTFRWGIAAADFDLDGWVDILEATGHLASDDEARDMGLSLGGTQPDNLMMNRRDGTMVAVDAEAADGLSASTAMRGLTVADLDLDGRLDVVLAPAYGAPALLHNRRATSGHWLRIVLEGKGQNTRAVGAQVNITSAGFRQLRQVVAGEGYLGNFDRALHVGLPTSEAVSIEVVWPDGQRTAMEDVEVDQAVVITQSS